MRREYLFIDASEPTEPVTLYGFDLVQMMREHHFDGPDTWADDLDMIVHGFIAVELTDNNKVVTGDAIEAAAEVYLEKAEWEIDGDGETYLDCPEWLINTIAYSEAEHDAAREHRSDMANRAADIRAWQGSR